MTRTITAEVEHNGTIITAAVEPTGFCPYTIAARIQGKVSITVAGIQAGDGLWGYGGNYIVDCDAHLDDEDEDAAYHALDDAVGAAVAAYLAEMEEIIALLHRAADDGGTIQARDMVRLLDDPSMHTTCSVRRVIQHLYPWLDQDNEDVQDWIAALD